MREPSDFQKQIKIIKTQKEQKKVLSDFDQQIEESQERDNKIIKNNYKNNFTTEDLQDAPQLVKNVLSLENSTKNEIMKFKIKQATKKFQIHENDCGSSGVQIAVLSERIISQINHLNDNRQDKKAARQLQALINQRRRIINYLRRTDFHKYKTVIAEYMIPDLPPLNSHHKENFRLFPNKGGRQVKK